MKQRFVIETTIIDSDALRQQLSQIGPAVTFEDAVASAVYRSPEVIALVGLAAGVLGAFLKGIFDMAVAKGAAKIVLKTAEGKTIEAPANISSQRLASLVEELNNLELNRIQIY
jgi:hypothetical protein